MVKSRPFIQHLNKIDRGKLGLPNGPQWVTFGFGSKHLQKPYAGHYWIAIVYS
ncbi:hypothetical protein [Neoasaia chiangmaiensis]|uniref:hypothetical protein n=1 Tax=Neoasaia chiangmaiensis TaxID=320497 RepID=UPI001472E81F|nr:hypothetical protein [Neoasaia chiangmaiensis]